jgi:hypothetical protein
MVVAVRMRLRHLRHHPLGDLPADPRRAGAARDDEDLALGPGDI